ncbi:MAG: methylated-DNA--[protein]-cysteine S-methyltransferase [Cellulosilyticaceae bacterium]
MAIYYEISNTPVGEICVLTTDEEIIEINLFKDEWQQRLEEFPDIKKGSNIGKEANLQLKEYFQGKRKEFNLPFKIVGTEYREKVWRAVAQIPYGQVVSYQDVAIQIGNPKSVRAIGQANRVNRMPIIIPCHRVIGKSGKMVGYAGDRINIKEYLLEHEKNIINKRKICL